MLPKPHGFFFLKSKYESAKSMKSSRINYAFIDSQNLNFAIRDQEWSLDWKKFRIHLLDKYAVSKAYLFIGYVEGNNELYTRLQESGFICIFKPTLKYKDGHTKGNCDAELVLWSMIEYPLYHRAVIVTGDGDFYCLVNHLIEKQKLEALLIPNRFKYSALLKFRLFRPYLRFMNDLRSRLEYKKEKAL